MIYDDVMRALEAAGSEQTRKTYRRHGIPDPMFGVSFAKLGELSRRIKTDHALASELWASGNADAQVLAAMVADPQALSAAELDGWVRAARWHTLTLYVAKLAVRRADAVALAEAWIADPGELVARAGWNLVAELAMAKGAATARALGDDAAADAFFAGLLPRIERDIHGAPNRAKEGMNDALIAIGIRSGALEQLAIASARRIGKVEVDHGDTSCKTPAAEPYILKARARKTAPRASTAAKTSRAPRAAEAPGPIQAGTKADAKA